MRQYSGHGVGRSMHEDPQVLNYIEPGQPNLLLKPGMVIAIEPMVNMGGRETRVLADDWTVVTADGSYSAHFEHTVAITEGDADYPDTVGRLLAERTPSETSQMPACAEVARASTYCRRLRRLR